MKLFNLDSPIMRFLSRMADVMWLNVLTVMLSIPLVTAGAAVTAMHYVCLKIIRDEDTYITKMYFKAFKENFKQATLMWLGFLAMFIVLILDFYLIFFGGLKLPTALVIVMIVVAFIVFAVYLWAFPLMARFVNTIRATLRNALIMMVAGFPRTLGMVGMMLIPLAATYMAIMEYVPSYVFLFVMLFGVAAPALGCASLYSPFFKRFEPEEEDLGDPDAMPKALRDQPDPVTLREKELEAMRSGKTSEQAAVLPEESTAPENAPAEEGAAPEDAPAEEEQAE